MADRQKVFRDSVHGYIQVPDEWCKCFIDTPIFQRLRRIEQTSMRCLYPSARHDRFIHSLGVYYLACQVADNLLANSGDVFPQDEAQTKNYLDTFRIACLLHDCAHAPFSHTFEVYYKRDQNLDEILDGLMSGDPSFAGDRRSCTPSPHEVASAIILLRHYREAIEGIGADPLLAARMITGCKYHGCGGDTEKLRKNALISLLNGKAIDVDKLDYIVRDAWASGVDSVSVDLDRLLSSITVAERKGNLEVVYRRTALSVVQSVVDARNYLYRWIYTHHKVVYDQYLLITALEKVAESLDKDGNGDMSLRTIFSLDTFDSYTELGSFRFHLVSDSELLYLLNYFQNEIPEAHEWLSRQHARKAIWKSRAEYESLFNDVSVEDTNQILGQLKDGILEKFTPPDLLYQEVKSKEVEILRNELFFGFDGKDPVSYTDFFEYGQPKLPERPFFYIYRDADTNVNSDELVEFLIKNK